VADDALPLLAFTLRELWDQDGGGGRLTLVGYRDRLGGVQGALARVAEALFAERRLTGGAELHMHKALLSMVRIDEEGRYVRKPAPWHTLPQDIHELLERFVQARLLVARSEGAERFLEVAHEALFRSWERLVGWLKTDHEFLLWHRRLSGAMAEWERNTHDEHLLLQGPLLGEAERWLAERPEDLREAERTFLEASVARRERDRAVRERRRRRTLVGLSIALLVVSLLAGFALWQRGQAEAQRQQAEAQRQHAQQRLIALYTCSSRFLGVK
jgi:hypothetical protein